MLDPGSWAEVPGVCRYDPKVTTERSGGSTVGGRRSYAFLMIPERPGKIEIPAHTLAFFDPEAEAYQTVASPVVEVVVGGDPTAIVASSDEAPEPAVGLEEPLAPVFSVETVPRRLPRERWLTNERWLYGMLGVPMLALLGLGAGMAWRRFGPDEAAVARARARDRRRARIEEAEAAVESGAGFHTALANLLQEVALDRAGPAGVGLPRPELIRMLDAHGVSGDERRRLESLLDRCDAARFGAQSGSASDRHALLDEALAACAGGAGPGNFIVYFGFDRTNLTDRARATLDEVVAAVQSMGATALSVVGHADTVGSVSYNQGLSERRARRVANALVERGVPAGSMTLAGRSENDPARATGDNVREPLNRRVEITLSK